MLAVVPNAVAVATLRVRNDVPAFAEPASYVETHVVVIGGNDVVPAAGAAFRDDRAAEFHVACHRVRARLSTGVLTTFGAGDHAHRVPFVIRD